MSSKKNENGSLVEIYKIHCELADRVSERRGKTNQFYVSLLSALLLGTGFFLKELAIDSFIKIETFLLTISILGILLCFLWWFHIKSFRQLNSAKYLVLHELEQKLEYPFYSAEWKMLGKGKKPKKYFQLTRIEQFAPIILIFPYIILLIHSISQSV